MSANTQNIPVVAWLEKLGDETGLFKVSKSGQSRASYDMRAVLKSDGGNRVVLYVESRKRVTPKLAMGIIGELENVPPDGHPVLCTYSVSPRVAEICRNHNVSYLDEAGNCWIRVPGLCVHIAGRPPTRPDTRPAVDPFAPRSSRLARVLLTDPSRAWTLSALAKEAQVSTGLVWKVKKVLIDEGYIHMSDKLIAVSDPAGLLDAWMNRYRGPGEKVSLYSIGKTAELEDRLDESCRAVGLRYALTGLSGAWRVAPMVRYTVASAFVEAGLHSTELADLIDRLDARPVESGANLVLHATDDESVFSGTRQLSGKNIVSPVQLYLDLMQTAGRGKDVAEEIMDKEIAPLFNVL